MGKLLHFPERIPKLPTPSQPKEPTPIPELYEDRFDFDIAFAPQEVEYQIIVWGEFLPLEDE